MEECTIQSTKSRVKSPIHEAGPLKSCSSQKENSLGASTNEPDNSILLSSASKRTASPSTDDSLVDFKSPKIATKSKTTVQVIPNKPKTKTKRLKKRPNEIKKSQINQPSIESSFFKPPSANQSFLCPLCLKSFSESSTQVTHTKNCALRNNVSTKTLLEAAKLQERQCEERLAIGLPTGAYQQPKKKSSNLTKKIPKSDLDLQLALAMSESLREHEERQVFDEAIALAAETDEKVLEMSSTQRKSTLQSFGFLSNRPPVLDHIEKPRRKKLLGPTILQTRNQEARERILSDKISQVLIGTDSITQLQLAEENPTDSPQKLLILQSGVLKSMHKTEENIWGHSASEKVGPQFYVKDLSPFIIPRDIPNEEIGIESPKNADKPIEIEAVSNPPQTSDPLSEVICEPPNLIKDDVNIEFSDTLAVDWSKMVNSKSCSDVLILLKDNQCLYTHWVVLLARCQSIVQDFLPNHEPGAIQRQQVAWLKITFESALAFMEFVYCGRIIHPEALDNNEVDQQVRFLAKKYAFKELSTYLDKNTADKSKNQEDSSEEIEVEPPITAEPVIEISDGENTLDKLKVPIEPISESVHRYSDVNTSPDLFSDLDMTYHTSLNSKQSIKEDKIILDSSNPCYLVNCSKTEGGAKLADTEELKETPKRTIKRSLTCPTFSSQNLSRNVVKSDMSMFINKVRRKNAKGLLDSDSDEESPLQPHEKPRWNPFKIRRDLKRLTLPTTSDVEVKKSKLSLFEDELRLHVAKSPIKSLSNSHQGINLSEVNRDEEIPDQNMGDSSELLDYSEQDELCDENESMYTKYMKSRRHNSIGDYRNILKRFVKKNDEISSPKCHEISEINQLRLAELSAFDVFASMSVSQSEASQEDISGSQKSFESTSRMSISPVNLSQNLDDKKSGGKDSIQLKSFEMASNGDEFNIGDLNFDTSDDFPYPLTQSRPANSSNNHSHDEKEELLRLNSVDLTLTDEEEAAETYPVIRSSQSSAVDIAGVLRECGLVDTTPHKKKCNSSLKKSNSVSSLILLSSDSEVEVSGTMSGALQNQDVDYECNFGDFVLEGGADSSAEACPVNSDDFALRISSQPSRASLDGNRDARLFKVKSKSEGNFPIRQKDPKLSPEIPGIHRILHYFNLSSSQAEVSLNVPPKEDYESLSSVELSQRLAMYGLRSQKHHRAVQLLDYIYNQLHPLVPKDLMPLVSDPIPIDEGSESDSPSPTDIPEELELSGEEYDEQEVAMVQQAFNKLLKDDTQLHRKVLMYEPLPLESLHAQLKLNGLQSGPKVLADYLDDECISFYVECPKKAATKRKK